MNFDVMVTLVIFGAHSLNFIYYITFILILYILVYFGGFFKERSVFYEFLCEGPSVLRKYKLTVVRGLKNMLVIEKMCGL